MNISHNYCQIVLDSMDDRLLLVPRKYVTATDRLSLTSMLAHHPNHLATKDWEVMGSNPIAGMSKRGFFTQEKYFNSFINIKVFVIYRPNSALH